MLNASASHSGENRKAVIGSPIVAKAVLVSDDRKCRIIVVFQKSTRQEFYWVFQARSPRSGRRSWKLVNHFPKHFNMGNCYSDFGSFVAYFANSYHMRVVMERTPHKRDLSRLLVKTEHESILGNWEPQDPSKLSVDRNRERATRARVGKWAW